MMTKCDSGLVCNQSWPVQLVDERDIVRYRSGVKYRNSDDRVWVGINKVLSRVYMKNESGSYN